MTARLPSDLTVKSSIDFPKKQILLTPCHFSPYSQSEASPEIDVCVCGVKASSPIINPYQTGAVCLNIYVTLAFSAWEVFVSQGNSESGTKYLYILKWQ